MKHYPLINLNSRQSILKNRAFWLSLLMLIIITTTFWTQSRVPALNEKAQMGDRINISAIAFDSILAVHESQPLYERTYKSSINWAYTNWKGMTFGFLLAATFITLLQTLPKARTKKNHFLNSLLGLVMGTPLGVCVNCATPIAQGMIQGGARLETSLSLLLSSPTLNPIVLTIAISLLPLHMVIIKVILSVFFILIIIPFLVRYHMRHSANKNPTNIENTTEIEKNTHLLIPEDNENEAQTSQQSWLSAFKFTAISILKNLIYIIKITLPLMILAGLLGSLLIQALPSGSLSELTTSPLNLLIMAAIGVFLPVPIAFDILIINILFMSGLDAGLAASLLFSLGIFSIYPALIIAKTQSLKLSLLITACVIIFAIIAGISTSLISQKINLDAKKSIEIGLKNKHQKISYDTVFSTCMSFDNISTKKSCLQAFLSSSSFSSTHPEACELKKPENINHDSSLAAIKICKQIITFTNTKKQAISENNIGICNQLKPDNLIDECKTNFIRSRSLEYTSLDPCLQIKNTTRQRYCRSYVLADRMSLKSTETCNLKLSENMHRQCIDNLNAHITSELGEIKKCNVLNTNNAKEICRSTVVSLKISNLEDYSVCEQLKSPSEIKHCSDLVILQKSLHKKDPSSCATLTNKRLREHCLISAAIRQAESTIELTNLASFKNTAHENKTAEGNQHTEKDYTITAAPKLDWIEIYNNKNISISYVDHFKRNIKKGTIFNKSPGNQYGLKSAWRFDLTDFMEPFMYGKGIASGDFNNDGWPDLAFASSNGIELYSNTGSQKNRRQFQHTASINLDDTPLNSFIVTFVDIDNDGWQDLFVSAYAGDNIFFKNNAGHFSSDSTHRLKNSASIVSLAAGFSDWNKDGFLDLSLGNWSYGAEGAFIPEKSQNIWYENNAMKFSSFSPSKLLGEPLGETLSILMSDLNNDNAVDMIIGNDRKYPDILYYGHNQERFEQITKSMNYLTETSLNTMSYDSADFNNDLLLDIFSTDMSIAPGSNRHYCESLNTTSDKSRCNWLLQANKAVESLDVGWCALQENKKRSECYTAMAIKLAKRDKNTDLCDKVSASFTAKAQLCRNITHSIKDIKIHNENQQLQQKESNKLLINAGGNHFVDATDSMQVSNSYWSWTGKAADLDNDQWQDIYIGNGLGFGEHDKNIHSNVFYHNQKGRHFKRAELEFGLADYTNTPSYTYVDFDLDGDIDIISSGVMSSPSVFINQGTLANSISFALRDTVANKFCIGCKIIIYYDDAKKSQIRELKLSGGFMSYDDPIAYFGLSDYKHIDHLEIIWSDGKSAQINKPLAANRRYKITRQTN
ncbi:Alkaline phosphatase [hydrothermal vent metagenome]|uniref:Alkaline phosphatase n=1 Tax=hydrothermal vent metagenome TaxID=652676 RepID=A0A3B0Y3Q8_9ZZZZ